MSQEALRELLRSTRGMLAYQGELGLRGLELGSDALRAWPAAQARTPTGVPASVPARPADRPSQQPTRPADGAAALAALRTDIGDCRRCKLCDGRTHIVFGVGEPKARLMFVGEGPGRDEDLQGEPFVGPAGQLLDKMIVAMGLQRSSVYIANIVKCRPPRNRDPEPDEVAACEPFLRHQIDIVRPEVIVALGRYAAQTLLRTPSAISRLRGQWSSYAGIPLMPTFHPAYLLRNAGGKRAVWMDLQQVMARLGLRDPRKHA